MYKSKTKIFLGSTFIMINNIFYGRNLVIATMHKKEQVIAPLLHEKLGVKIIVPNNFDTDQFGTFSGEIERKVDPIEAARQKCKEACQQYNCTLAIASEGSFGPHPSMFFVPADDEILMLIDLENQLEIKARALSTKTNFSGSLFTTWKDVQKFAEAVKFPEHGLIAREKEKGTSKIIKGIDNWDSLQNVVKKYLVDYGKVFLETDMRASYNPTRLSVIEQATQKLLSTIENICPNCATPGFDVVDVSEGLSCSQCGMPTRSIQTLIFECQKCGTREDRKPPNNKIKEDPMYCDWCNP